MSFGRGIVEGDLKGVIVRLRRGGAVMKQDFRPICLSHALPFRGFAERYGERPEPRRNRPPGLTIQARRQEAGLPFGRTSAFAYTPLALRVLQAARLQMIPVPVSAQPWQ